MPSPRWRRAGRSLSRWWWRTRFRRRRALGRFALVVFGLCLAFVAGEIGLRLRARFKPYDMHAELERANRSRPPPLEPDCATARQAALGELVRPSADPEIVYEFKPHLDTCFYRAPVHLNGEGLRAPVEYARPKPPGVYRVLFLGDSMTFGQGLPYEQTFVAQLQQMLSSTGRPTEVINTGVPGYNTAQEAAYLRREGMSYQPDCVMILFIGNDLGLPHLMMRPRQPTYAGSYVLGELNAALRPQRLDAFANWFDVARGPLADEVADDDLERVPEEYRHMVGLEGYRRALRSIRETVPREIPVVNCADYGPIHTDPEALVRYQRELGISVPSCPFPVTREYWQSEQDHHLNAFAAAEMTRRLLAGLRQSHVCLPPGL